jgi:hypothetical protein
MAISSRNLRAMGEARGGLAPRTGSLRTGQEGSAMPTLSRWAEDIGSPNPFIVGRFGSLDGAWARQIPTQEAEDSGSDRAEFQAGLRVRGLPVPLLSCVSYRPGLRVRGLPVPLLSCVSYRPWTDLSPNRMSRLTVCRSGIHNAA